MSTLLAIAKALGASMDHLIGLRDEPPSAPGASPLAARLASRAAELNTAGASSSYSGPSENPML